jgi:hypothetical protein
MLNTSFTLRPSTSAVGSSSQGNSNGDSGGVGVEVTFREPRPVIKAPVRRISEETTLYHYRRYPSYPERAFKRQRLFSHHDAPTNFNHHPVHPPFPFVSTAVEQGLPQIRRIPMEFQPPSDEAYWKRRCFRMQSICQDTRRRMRDMEEDQRQLRRRIQELEKQLLLQSSFNSLTVLEEETHIVDSRECDDDEEEEMDPGNTELRLGDARGDSNERVVGGDSRKRASLNLDGDKASTRMKLPTILSIPKVQPAASCFYLTDGEGLSDSEFMEDYDDPDIDEREGSGCLQRG